MNGPDSRRWKVVIRRAPAARWIFAARPRQMNRPPYGPSPANGGYVFIRSVASRAPGSLHVRIRSLGEERHPKDLAHSAERERDRRDVEPRAPDRDGGRLSGPGRRGPPVALVRGRGYLLEVRHHSPRVETWTGRKPRMEGDVGSRRLRLHSRPRGHHENPRGGEEIQRRDRVQRRMVPPREAEPTARRPTGPRVRHGGPRPFVRVRRAGVAGDGA